MQLLLRRTGSGSLRKGTVDPVQGERALYCNHQVNSLKYVLENAGLEDADRNY